MRIKDYPVAIINLAIHEKARKQQIDMLTIKHFVQTQTPDTGLAWASTQHGNVFWGKINEGVLSPFYNEYPQFKLVK